MPDDHTPKPFTEAQHQLFKTVSKLNRSRPKDFAEADLWIGTKPRTAADKLRAFREEIVQRARRGRSEKNPLSILDVGGEMGQWWRECKRWEQWYLLRNPSRVPSGWIYSPNVKESDTCWPIYPGSKALLACWRRERAKTIRSALQDFARNIKDEDARGPLQSHDLIFQATQAILELEPFEGMNPRKRKMWGRRALRVVWVLTETADLAEASATWIKDWKWGERATEFLDEQADGSYLPIPRLWCRVNCLDPDMERWEKVACEALEAIEEADAPAPVEQLGPVLATMTLATASLPRVTAPDRDDRGVPEASQDQQNVPQAHDPAPQSDAGTKGTNASKPAAGAEVEITQAEFARITGLSPSTVCKRAKSGTPMTMDEARRITTAAMASSRSSRRESDSEVEKKFSRL